MNTVLRYNAVDGDPVPDGTHVRFADVEEALRDKARLAWLMPVLDGSDDVTADMRLGALTGGLLGGLTGTALVDAAMAACPA